MKNQQLFAVHLLNDYSGSPLVFKQALESLNIQYNIHLFTSTPSSGGFLSDLEGIEKTEIFYKWNRNKLVTLFLFLFSQWKMFWQIRKHATKNDTVYINTLLPFGAALGAASKKCTIIYHIHEVSIKPVLLKRFLAFVAEKTANRVLFVSDYVAAQFQFKKPTALTIHNALPESFTQQAKSINSLNTSFPFTVLMLCSLKAYKGIYEFVKIAKAFPAINFNLVLNASQENVEAFKKETNPTKNCMLYASQKNTLPFYEKAHLVMNLSRPNQWIETFGMTILEAMYCGRPVIVPPVGGVKELVDDGVEGFTINSNQVDKVIDCIQTIVSDFELYETLSKAAIKKANAFTQMAFNSKILFAFSEKFAITPDTNLAEKNSIPRNAIFE